MPCADEQYPVDKIIANRWEMNNGVLECLYNLRWEGFGKEDDTWQTAAPDDLVEAFKNSAHFFSKEAHDAAVALQKPVEATKPGQVASEPDQGQVRPRRASQRQQLAGAVAQSRAQAGIASPSPSSSSWSTSSATAVHKPDQVAAENGKYPKIPPGVGAPPSREVEAEPEQDVTKPKHVVAAIAAAQLQAQAAAASSSSEEQVVADPDQVEKLVQEVADPVLVVAKPEPMVTTLVQVVADPDQVVAEPDQEVAKPAQVVAAPVLNVANQVVAEPEQKAAADAAAQSQAQAAAASSSSEGQVVADPDQVAKPAQVVADPKLVVATPERMVTSPEHVVAELDQVAAELDQVVAEPGQDVAKPEQKKAAAVAAVQLQAQAATASSSSEASSSSSSSAAAASIAHSEATERNFVYIGMQLKCMNPFTDQYITVTVKRFAEEAFDDNCSGIVTDLGDPIDKHDQVMVMHPGKTPYRACAGDLVQVDRPWDVGPGAVVQEHTEPDAEVVREIPIADFGAVPLNAAAEAIKPDGAAQFEEKVELQDASPCDSGSGDVTRLQQPTSAAPNAAEAIVFGTLFSDPGALVLHVNQLQFELLTGRVGELAEMRKMAFPCDCYYDKLFKSQPWGRIQFSLGFHSPEGATVIMAWFVEMKVASVELHPPPFVGLDGFSFSNGYTPPAVGQDGAWVLTLGEILKTNWTFKDKPAEPNILIDPTDANSFKAALKYGGKIPFLDGQADEMREHLCNQLHKSGPEYSQIVAAIVVQDDKSQTQAVCRESAKDLGLLGVFNQLVLDEYITKMRLPTTWGDHLEIAIFTQAVDFRVCVTEYYGGVFSHCGNFGNGSGTTIHLLYLNKNHYAALLPCHAVHTTAQLAVIRTALDLAPFAPIKLRSAPDSGTSHWMLYNGPRDGKCLFRMLAFLKLTHQLSTCVEAELLASLTEDSKAVFNHFDSTFAAGLKKAEKSWNLQLPLRKLADNQVNKSNLDAEDPHLFGETTLGTVAKVFLAFDYLGLRLTGDSVLMDPTNGTGPVTTCGSMISGVNCLCIGAERDANCFQLGEAIAIRYEDKADQRIARAIVLKDSTAIESFEGVTHVFAYTGAEFTLVSESHVQMMSACIRASSTKVIACSKLSRQYWADQIAPNEPMAENWRYAFAINNACQGNSRHRMHLWIRTDSYKEMPLPVGPIIGALCKVAVRRAQPSPELQFEFEESHGEGNERCEIRFAQYYAEVLNCHGIMRFEDTIWLFSKQPEGGTAVLAGIIEIATKGCSMRKFAVIKPCGPKDAKSLGGDATFEAPVLVEESDLRPCGVPMEYANFEERNGALDLSAWVYSIWEHVLQGGEAHPLKFGPLDVAPAQHNLGSSGTPRGSAVDVLDEKQGISPFARQNLGGRGKACADVSTGSGRSISTVSGWSSSDCDTVHLTSGSESSGCRSSSRTRQKNLKLADKNRELEKNIAEHSAQSEVIAGKLKRANGKLTACKDDAKEHTAKKKADKAADKATKSLVSQLEQDLKVAKEHLERGLLEQNVVSALDTQISKALKEKLRAAKACKTPNPLSPPPAHVTLENVKAMFAQHVENEKYVQGLADLSAKIDAQSNNPAELLSQFDSVCKAMTQFAPLLRGERQRDNSKRSQSSHHRRSKGGRSSRSPSPSSSSRDSKRGRKRGRPAKDMESMQAELQALKADAADNAKKAADAAKADAAMVAADNAKKAADAAMADADAARCTRKKKRKQAQVEKENTAKSNLEAISAAVAADRTSTARLEEELAREARNMVRRKKWKLQRAAPKYAPVTPEGLSLALEVNHIPHSITHGMENARIDGETFMGLADEELESFCGGFDGTDKSINLEKLVRARASMRGKRKTECAETDPTQ